MMTSCTIQLAYLVGLPPNEVPAVEMARGDLVEVTPASYGVMTRAYHFWFVSYIPLIDTGAPDSLRSGEGRGDDTGQNHYENFAEATSGSGSILPEYGMNFATEAQNMEAAAVEEETKDKVEKADFVRKQLEERLVEGIKDGTRSTPGAVQMAGERLVDTQSHHPEHEVTNENGHLETGVEEADADGDESAISGRSRASA